MTSFSSEVAGPPVGGSNPHCSTNEVFMTPIQIRAAHRIGAAYLRQSKEKARDLLYVRKTIPVIV